MKNVISSAMLIGAFGIAATANAGTIIPNGLNLELSFGGNSWSIWDNPESITDVVEDEGGDMHITGAWMVPGEFDADWSVTLGFNGDDASHKGGTRGAGFAFISNNFSVVNLNGVPQDFVITISQVEAPIGAPTQITGSNVGEVGDGGGAAGGTLESTPGLPFYEALMDGVGVRTLFDSPQTVIAPQFLTQSYGPDSFIGEANANGVAASIGIVNRFRLSAGDRAGMTSTFAVIPTPGTTSLLAIVGFAAIRRRR